MEFRLIHSAIRGKEVVAVDLQSVTRRIIRRIQLEEEILDDLRSCYQSVKSVIRGRGSCHKEEAADLLSVVTSC